MNKDATMRLLAVAGFVFVLGMGDAFGDHQKGIGPGNAGKTVENKQSITDGAKNTVQRRTECPDRNDCIEPKEDTTTE